VDELLGLDAARAHLEQVRQTMQNAASDIAMQAQDEAHEAATQMILSSVAHYADDLDAILNRALDDFVTDAVRIVQATLESIVGEYPEEEILEKLITTQLSRLRRLTPLTFRVSAGRASAVKGILAENAAELAAQVIEDPKLDRDRVLVESRDGYFELGLAAQTDIAKRKLADKVAEAAMASVGFARPD
jgi:flagellar biosynthesis/type III secretory pathway protein FliH